MGKASYRDVWTHLKTPLTVVLQWFRKAIAMVSSSYQWLRNGNEAIVIALQWSFKGYIDQFGAIAMPLTNGIARPIFEMPREALTIASGYLAGWT